MKITVPIEILYFMTILCAILAVIFFMGKGSSIIAVHKITTEEEKEKYKKLSRVIRVCFGVVDIFLIIISLMRNQLPEWFTYVFIAIISAAILVVAIISSIDVILKK